MCVMSMVMNDAIFWPVSRWRDPDWVSHFNKLIEDAKRYDREHDQSNCENVEKEKQLRSNIKLAMEQLNQTLSKLDCIIKN